MILVIGPYPTAESCREGMMQRIAAIDRILAGDERVYLTPRQELSEPGPFVLEPIAPGVRAGAPNLFDREHVREMMALAREARLVVAHSLHWAQLAVPLFGLGHVVTDLHGAVPEEQELAGNRDSASWFGRVERFVVARSKCLIAVTDAMADHLRAKYPDLSPSFVTLPMMSTVAGPASGSRAAAPPWRLVYAGGTQVWQNIDRMLEALSRARLEHETEILTPDVGLLARKVLARGLVGRVRVRSVPPAEMPAAYAGAHLAFVLRDDDPVNRVACPTKLQEALAHGVVPIVKCPAIGDFPRWGYRYLSLEQFEAGRLPIDTEWRAMVEANRGVFDRLRATVEVGTAKLSEIIDDARPPRSEVAGSEEALLHSEPLLEAVSRWRGRPQPPRRGLLRRYVKRLLG